VTIAIGLSCNEGIVLAADSQETISYLKQDVGKLRSVITEHCIVSFAGAGWTDYINTAIEVVEVLPMLRTKR
jgi:20S proteasome alpha/beta subunit